MQRAPTLPSVVRKRRARLVSVLVLLLLPVAMLHEALFGGHDYVPFDLTIFPPASIGLAPAEVAKRRDGGNYDVTEKTALCAQEYRLAREEIADGRFPHWNPYVRGGAPLFANALNGFAYPVHWLFLGLDPERAFGFAAWLAFALAGVFMFGFLREIGLQVLPALFGAVAFQFSGTLAANGHFFMRMETLVWLPAGFWALERLFQRRGVRRIPPFCAFAACLGLCWLAGFPPYALACSLAFGLYILTLGVRSARDHGIEAGFAMLGWAGTAVLVGIGISAVQLLPMLDYFPEAQRKLNQTPGQLSAQGLDPAGLLGFVMPAPWGHPTESAILPYTQNPLLHLVWSRTDPATGKLHYPINFNYTEYAVYLGVLPLLCIVLTLFKGSARFRHFAGPAFLLFLVFATGGAVFGLVSGVSIFQSSPPSRFACVACFFGAALAAMGLEIGPTALTKVKHGVATAVAAIISIACFVLFFWSNGLAGDEAQAIDEVVAGMQSHWKESFPAAAADTDAVKNMFGRFVKPALDRFSSQALYGGIAFLLGAVWIFLLPRKSGARAERTGTVLTLVAIVATAVEMIVLAVPVNPTFPRRDPADTPVHEFLRKARAAAGSDGGFTVARVATTPAEPLALPPNLLIPERIRDLNCYAFVDKWSSLPIRHIYGNDQMIRDFWFKSFPPDERLQLGLFDMLGVRYLLSTEELKPLGPPVVPAFSGPGGSFWIYERKTALPRAFLVPRAERVASDNGALTAICAKEFDPRERVLLHVPEKAVLSQLEDPARLGAASVRFTKDTPSAVDILVSGSPGAWLVLADSPMSHWGVTIDGGAAQWHRANLLCRAVWIPPGDHEVRFRYDAAPFRRGLFVTAFLIGCMLLLMIWWNGHPQKRDPDVVEAATE